MSQPRAKKLKILLEQFQNSFLITDQSFSSSAIVLKLQRHIKIILFTLDELNRGL